MYPPIPAGLSRGKHAARLSLKSPESGCGLGGPAGVGTFSPPRTVHPKRKDPDDLKAEGVT
jgi:hypothetical protein